jgi:ATP-dependent Lhr-like helicase
VLLTTPESLALLASYPESADLFASVKRVVVDEIHAFAQGKRGDLLALTLARIQALAPDMVRVACRRRWPIRRGFNAGWGPIRRWCWARRACPRMWM